MPRKSRIRMRGNKLREQWKTPARELVWHRRHDRIDPKKRGRHG